MKKDYSHLEPDTIAWIDGVLRDFQLEGHHRRLLILAGESFDRSRQARRAIDKHGLTFKGPSGPRARPEVAIERDSKVAFARLLREIGLDIEPPNDAPRPPRIGGA